MARKNKNLKNASGPSKSSKTDSATKITNFLRKVDADVPTLPKTLLEWKDVVDTLIDSENFRSHNEFYAYLLIRLYHPEASEFLISLADELCSNYMNGDIDEDQIWQYMEKLNSYLIHRHGILYNPLFLNAFANEFSCDKPINKPSDLVVALNQVSAGSAYRSSSDEVLFWDFVFGETFTQELFETYNDYLIKLADYVCCQNNQLLTSSLHGSSFCLFGHPDCIEYDI